MCHFIKAKRSSGQASQAQGGPALPQLDSSRSSSSSSELQAGQRNLSNSSENSSSHSSTYNRSASSSCLDSCTEKKYSSASTIISVGSSVFSKTADEDSKGKSKKSKTKESLTTTAGKGSAKSADPFRQAPFRVQPSLPIDLSSSESSNSSILTNDPPLLAGK